MPHYARARIARVRVQKLSLRDNPQPDYGLGKLTMPLASNVSHFAIEISIWRVIARGSGGHNDAIRNYSGTKKSPLDLRRFYRGNVGHRALNFTVVRPPRWGDASEPKLGKLNLQHLEYRQHIGI